MSLYDDFKKYRDQYGLNGLYTDGTNGESTQNGALFTLEYLICLINDPNTSDSVKQAEITRLISTYESLETFPGISSRVPGGQEFDSMDNTGAIFTFSGLFDNGNYSKRSYIHGSTQRAESIDQGQGADLNNKYYVLAKLMSGWKAPRFFWNNNNPKQFCFFGWHGRSPGHIAYLKMTAGKWVGPLGQLSILVGQFLGCFADKGNADARKLPYINWQYLKKRNFIWKGFYKLWCQILIKQYPNGMQDVYRMYYGDPNHPMRTYPKTFEP
jgi:hypothetical protein